KVVPEFDSAEARARFFSEGPRPVGGWARVLRGYLAWEAAIQGRVELAPGGSRPSASAFVTSQVNTDDLCDSLLVAIARKISPGDEAKGLLGMAPDADVQELLRTYPEAKPLSEAEQPTAIKKVMHHVGYLFGRDFDLVKNPSMLEFSPEYAEGDPEMVDAERAGDFVRGLRDDMVAITADLEGQDLIAKILRAVQINPYPYYRDNALVAVGMASLVSPNTQWARGMLREILKTGLEAEGIVYTLDLPAEVSEAALEQGIDARGLSGLVHAAELAEDRWGSRFRAASALAAAQFHRGKRADSAKRLGHAVTVAWDEHRLGFAGIAVLNLLSVVSRWVEFGLPHFIQQNLGTAGPLPAVVMHRAQNVRDPRLRKRRTSLAQDYSKWLNEKPETLEAVEDRLRQMDDSD